MTSCKLELNEQITTKFESARTKLLEHLDEDVHYKLRLRESETKPPLDRYSDWLWALTATELNGHADDLCAGHLAWNVIRHDRGS